MPKGNMGGKRARNNLSEEEIKGQIRAWQKERKNRNSKYSDYFIDRQIESYEKQLNNRKGKLTKLYDDDKRLIGYDYKGHKIEIDYRESTSYYNQWKRDGYIITELRDRGQASFVETLKEAKQQIENKLVK